MNYYLFTTDLRRAGAQHVVSVLAERWSRDVNVTIIIIKNDVEFNLPANVRVLPLDCATDPLHFYSGLMVWQAKHKLESILNEENGAFALYSFLESPNFISVLIKKKFPNGIFIGSSRTSILLYNRLFRLFYPSYTNLDGFIVNSEANKRLFVEQFGLPENMVHFIPNPIDFKSIQYQANEGRPQMLDQVAVNKKRILGVGRMVKQKNFSLLMRAFALLTKTESNVHLIILGDGPERRRLTNLAKRLGIANQLTMPGKVVNPYIWMANADLFVLSSNYEGWPNVLIEAMVMGLPVVACDCPTGPAEILGNGDHGVLVPKNDVEAMTAAMTSKLQSKKTPYFFLREWNADSIANRYRAVAESILTQRNG